MPDTTPDTFNPIRRGPQSPEAREKARADAKRGWKENRAKYMAIFNRRATRNGPPNPIRELRLHLKNEDGSPMTQTDFAVAIGLSRSNQKAVSAFENGLRPTALLLAAMQRLAEEQGISWSYE